MEKMNYFMQGLNRQVTELQSDLMKKLQQKKNVAKHQRPDKLKEGIQRYFKNTILYLMPKVSIK